MSEREGRMWCWAPNPEDSGIHGEVCEGCSDDEECMVGILREKVKVLEVERDKLKESNQKGLDILKNCNLELQRLSTANIDAEAKVKQFEKKVQVEFDEGKALKEANGKLLAYVRELNGRLSERSLKVEGLQRTGLEFQSHLTEANNWLSMKMAKLIKFYEGNVTEMKRSLEYQELRELEKALGRSVDEVKE